MADDENKPPDDQIFVGFDDDAYDINPDDRAIEFLFDGRGMTADEFSDFVSTFNFRKQGLDDPDFVVLHHSANPHTLLTRDDARHGPEDWIVNGTTWDGGEVGMSEAQIKDHRFKQLEGLRDFYKNTNKWDRGPHLFIDDRYIWLMTPMTEFGVHAVGGNWFAGGKHRSIGIEVIGYYEKQHWPPAVERNVASAVNTLMNRLGTFELRYLYPNGSPLSFKIGDVVHYQHPERLTFGGICAHRDFNKPMCPGGAITSDYYIGVLKAGADDGVVVPVVRSADPLALDSPLIGRVSGSKEAAERYLTAHLTPASEYNQNDVAAIVGSYWEHATAAGIDPLVALAQCALETKNLSSFWSQRPRRNPAGLGVPDQNKHDVGLQFPSWDASSQAHLGQILAYALRDDQTVSAQRKLLVADPILKDVEAALRGSAHTVADLGARWSPEPSYAEALVNIANDMRAA